MTKSQSIARDIRTLERHLDALQGIHTDLRARDALAKHGAANRIAALVAAYKAAIRELEAQHMAAEIAECTAHLWTLTGQERANMRWYLRDLIGASRGERRAG